MLEYVCVSMSPDLDGGGLWTLTLSKSIYTLFLDFDETFMTPMNLKNFSASTETLNSLALLKDSGHKK